MHNDSLLKKHASRLSLGLVLMLLVPATGCIHTMIATGVYLWEGGNFAPAECKALEQQRVVVFCRQPASHEFRHSGASRMIAERVSEKLDMNVPGIEVVAQRHVDNWIDENDSDDFEELGKAVEADMVVYIDLGHFELFKGKTVYQGNTLVSVSVHDMKQKGKRVWEKEMGEVLYPRHSGVAVQDKPKAAFQKEFINVVADEIAVHFYKHDPHANFAIDAIANR